MQKKWKHRPAKRQIINIHSAASWDIDGSV